MTEQRRFPRLDDKVIVSYIHLNPDYGPQTGIKELPCWLTSISLGGAGIRTEDALPPDTPLGLLLCFKTRDGRFLEIEIQAITRWSREDRPGGPFLSGLEFTDLQDDQQQLVEELIALMQEQNENR